MPNSEPANALAPSSSTRHPTTRRPWPSPSPRCRSTARHSCDVCIVGGGFTGCAAALHLARRGITVKLLEQSLLGWGASGRNGGQVHVGLRRNQNWLEGKLGASDARKLWELALAARAHLMRSLRPTTSSVTTGPDCCTPTIRLAIHARRGAMSLICASVRLCAHPLRRPGGAARARCNRRILRCVLDMRGGHLHPLNLVLGIARAAQSHGAQLHEAAEGSGSRARRRRIRRYNAAAEVHAVR